MEHFKSINSALFCGEDFVASEVLWICLVDPKLDDAIMKTIGDESDAPITSPETQQKSHLSRIIEMKRDILEHLISLSRENFLLETEETLTKNSHLDMGSELEVLRSRFGHCLRLCSFLSLRLPRLREFLGNDQVSVSLNLMCIGPIPILY